MGPSSPAVQFVYHGPAGPGFLLHSQVFLASEFVYRSTFDFRPDVFHLPLYGLL